MKKIYRVQKNSTTNQVCSDKFKLPIRSNSYFLQLGELLLDVMTLEMVKPKDHIIMQPSKLYFTISQCALLSPKIGSQNSAPCFSVIEDFLKKYQDIKNDVSKMFQKRIQILYEDFFLIKNSEEPDTFGIANFFNKQIQKSNEILIFKTQTLFATLDRQRVKKQIFNKLLRQYRERVQFLRSFPLLQKIPQLYFQAYLPNMGYQKYYVGYQISKKDRLNQKVFFLRLGQIEFSKILREDQVKVYKITGQQMFMIIDDIDIIKATSELVQIFSILKKDLDFLMVKSDYNLKLYETLLSDMRNYNIKLKQRACQFHEAKYSSHQKFTRKPTPKLSHDVFELSQSSNILTRQFSIYAKRLSQQKSMILERLMKKSRGNSFCLSKKSSLKTMSESKSLAHKNSFPGDNQYCKIRQHFKQNQVVSMYKQLVKAGLQRKLQNYSLYQRPNSKIRRIKSRGVYTREGRTDNSSEIRLDITAPSSPIRKYR